MEAKLIEIGNSKGLRLSKKLIQKYHLVNRIEIEEQAYGILLKPVNTKDSKLSWEDTFKEIKNKHEDWSDFDVSISDGIE